jgi:hypothetical protein
MKDLILFKQKCRTAMIMALAILASLAMSSCKKLDFTKTEIEEPTNEWLHYDNGTNYTGISANLGGDFDIAVRFSTSQIAIYDGFLISQVKFYPLVGYPAIYSITLWEGSEPPEFLYVQSVSVVSGTWNEVTVEDNYYVDASKDLWVGVWIQDYPSGTYPAGCDAGPANAGKGDLYSNDDGASWYSLYTTDGLNYNWNLQVYLTSYWGQKVILGQVNGSPAKEEVISKKNTHPGKAHDGMISLNKP